MSNNLPGYDAWKLAPPPYLAGYPPCTNCGHEVYEHALDGACFVILALGDCTCISYTDEPLEPDPDRAHDEARET